MEILAILALIEKGITIAGVLIDAGKSAAPAFEAILALIQGAKADELTQEDLDKTEAVLDTLIADFNTDLPPA